MMTLLEQARFNLRWDRRHDATLPGGDAGEAAIDAQIDAMTPLQLLTLISDTLQELENQK